MTQKSVSLQVSRRFDASAERVFDAWLDPGTMRHWLFTMNDSEIVRAELDPWVGGRFTFVDRRDDGDIEHVGEYLEIARPYRLVFRFAVPQFSPEYDRVTIEITRLGGGCELMLTTELSPGIFEKWGEQTKQGWTTMLGALATTLEDHHESR